jgi:hypothetical protein
MIASPFTIVVWDYIPRYEIIAHTHWYNDDITYPRLLVE